VAGILDDPSKGVYDGAGLALAGVHASSLGTAVTSDFLVHFAAESERESVAETARRFQAAPHALADPAWTCESLAAGWLHPYDPGRFETLESTVEDAVRGYWETQEESGEYGMWLYRAWHHTTYLGEGKWTLYRLYNATHHYEAFMPWMLYARSGDPFYLTQGAANVRLLADLQIIHYDDPDYPHREFHFGQGRLVGSTKHTNGFNTWGGDHGVFSHQTCYAGLILAHYLTGDLRLREVLVDEWQRTIVADRANPEFSGSDRSRRREVEGARDNANALGELIDLYQMTYHPALLAHMAPMLEIFLDCHMRHWGQPLHNVLLFYRSEQARRQLLEAVDAYRRALGKPEDPRTVWYTHSPHENFALASLQDPSKNYHIDAYLAAEPGRRREWARRIRAREPRAVAFCAVPDYVLYVPRVMCAAARAGGDVALGTLAHGQAIPSTDQTLGGWTRCIVREDEDGAIAVRFVGVVGHEEGMPVRIYGPDNRRLLDVTVPRGTHSPFTLTIPADGATGQYVVFFHARDNKDKLRAPLTDLPEVYHVAYWQQPAVTRFFTRSSGAAPVRVEVQPHKGSGEILSADGKTALALTSSGEMIGADVGEPGAWIVMRCRYVHVARPVTLAVSPERWFAPEESKLALKP
jgi:hypothetical protein